jgi:hypothetical protein
VTTVNQEDRSEDAVWVPRKIISEVTPNATISIRGIVIDSTYLPVSIEELYLP